MPHYGCKEWFYLTWKHIAVRKGWISDNNICRKWGTESFNLKGYPSKLQTFPRTIKVLGNLMKCHSLSARSDFTWLESTSLLERDGFLTITSVGSEAWRIYVESHRSSDKVFEDLVKWCVMGCYTSLHTCYSPYTYYLLDQVFYSFLLLFNHVHEMQTCKVTSQSLISGSCEIKGVRAQVCQHTSHSLKSNGLHFHVQEIVFWEWQSSARACHGHFQLHIHFFGHQMGS